ncbi:MAG: cytidine deaminase [Desulfobacteraceae bacterium]|nr:cytidine deaminase [Desulfobacteraceae bacterium]
MNKEQKQLLEAARRAADSAYAPYSKFKVGAAVSTKTGIFTGANIENASTNLGICAERVAIAHARMNGQTRIEGVAVCCEDAPRNADGSINEEMCMPCGGCRQWLAELAPEAWIITNATHKIYRVDDLLPFAFKLNT